MSEELAQIQGMVEMYQADTNIEGARKDGFTRIAFLKGTKRRMNMMGHWVPAMFIATHADTDGFHLIFYTKKYEGGYGVLSGPVVVPADKSKILDYLHLYDMSFMTKFIPIESVTTTTLN